MAGSVFNKLNVWSADLDLNLALGVDLKLDLDLNLGLNLACVSRNQLRVNRMA